MSDQQTNNQRDSATLKLMGYFFIVFALLVLAGLFWEQAADGRVVNVIASSVLLVIGGGSLLLSRRLRQS